MLKCIFCKHDYKKIAKRISNYTNDYIFFEDLGHYDDILYKCQKCGKEKIKVVPNEKNPFYNNHKWEKIEGSGKDANN